MKKNLVIPALIGVLAVLTLFAAVATWEVYLKSRKSFRLQAQLAQINNTRLVLDALAKETIDYGKRNPNPTMDRILESVMLKPGLSATNAKPATR